MGHTVRFGFFLTRYYGLGGRLMHVLKPHSPLVPIDKDIGVAFRKVFSKLLDEEENYLLKSAERRLYESGETIIKEKIACDGIFVMVCGEARVEYVRKSAEEDAAIVEVAIMERGDVMGEMSFLDGFPTSASVIANTEVEIFFIKGEMLEALLVGDPTFGGRFYRSLAINLSSRLRATNKNVEMVPRSRTLRWKDRSEGTC